MHAAATVRRSRRHRKTRTPFFVRLCAFFSDAAIAPTIEFAQRISQARKPGRLSPASAARYLVLLVFSLVIAGPLNTTEAGLSDLWTPGLLGWSAVNSDGFECRDNGEHRLPATIVEPAKRAHTYAIAAHDAYPVSGRGDYAESGRNAAGTASRGGGGVNVMTEGTGAGGAHVPESFGDHGAFASALNGGVNGDFMSADTHGMFGPHGGGSAGVGGTAGPNTGGPSNYPSDGRVTPANFNYAAPFTPTGGLGSPGRPDDNCCGGKENDPLVQTNFPHTALTGTDPLPGDESPNTSSETGDSTRLTTVPEPASFTLLALGWAGLGVGRRTRV